MSGASKVVRMSKPTPPETISPEPTQGRPRSLADDLRRRDDQALTQLLRLRPDLLNPVPADLRALAARATGAPSMARALDHFDAFSLAVACVAAQHDDPIVTDDVIAAVKEREPHVDPDRITRTLDQLHELGLTWGLPAYIAMVRGCRDILLAQSEEFISSALAQPELADPADAVVRAPQQVAISAAQNALERVRLIEALCRLWTTQPPNGLRTGGLSARDLARTADELDVDPTTAALLVETAYNAGLIANDGAADSIFTTTTNFDEWEQGDTATRWVTLARAGLLTDRVAGLVGARDSKDNKLAALSPDLERSYGISLRLAVLQELASLADHTSVSDATLIARLDWRRPRRVDPSKHAFIMWTTHEAATLGVTGLGALSPHGVQLIADPAGSNDEDLVVSALTVSLPQPVDHVILQPDLTAIAPGPLLPELARELSLLADIESTGGATVFRFSENSLRRGFDQGRDAATILDFITNLSRTPVPQPLEYAIADLAKRHGQLRIGNAACYIRCEDNTLLDSVMAASETQSLMLRRIAPSVVVSSASPTSVIDRLHAMGLTPTAEGPDGGVVITRGTGRQPTAHRPMVRLRDEAGPNERLLVAAVKALRSGEDTEGRTSTEEVLPTRPLPPRTPPAKTVSILRAAIDEGAALRIGYASSNGSTVEHMIDPVRVNAGQVTAYDHRGGDVRTFTISRIAGVEVIDPGSLPTTEQV